MTHPFYAPRFDIRISGATLTSDVTTQVTNVSYDNNVDLADMFSFTLRNPNNVFTDSPLFGLGKNVEIHLGYGNDLKPMMLGTVTSIEPSYPESGAPTLTISGYDRSYKLRHDEPDRQAWEYMDDTAIASIIAVEAGLIPVVDPSPFFHEHIQQTGPDMAFLKERADANFFEVYVNWDKLYFRLPRPQTDAIVLEWGRNLSSFAPRLSNAASSGLQIIRAYNEEMAENIVAVVGAGQLSLDDLVEKLGDGALDLLSQLGRRVIRDVPVNTPEEALALAQSILQQTLDGMFEGLGSCIGMPALRADQYVVIQGVGKRFSGRYRLKKVTHTIDSSGYRSHFEVTQRSRGNLLPFLRKVISELPAPNRQKKYHSVTTAKVTNNVDPKGLGRVKLSLPWFSDDNESNWARLATPMGGDGEGMYFLPDTGDEVLVGFQHGDLSKPVVHGSVWNGKQSPPANHTDGKNSVRMIRTKAGHSVTLDDSDGAEKITIQDKAGSQIVLDSSDGSITIKAASGDLNLEAPGGNVNVKTGGKLDVS